ncbi:PAS domain-containing protein [Nitrosomonas sp. JL21]|uniref:CheR family methyltransferase n=1 Tax=Nitrosomonas sp. JL21 TaxID=153949 RepID=UPI0013690852|nr:CheR family methyltransferase [Nitrosomonas sp. JL21]MBL8496586.1 PAS domain-containing protein [Nitrosomonas sp.]MXS77412.1 PAS domain-containing protein [Nitrosomonas sp. JL21]
MASRKKNITPIIVGIGSSAGGLEALQQLFKHIAPDSHKAFIVMQHLDPKHTSLLTEILQRCTSLPVTEISDGLQLMPNHIYVNPPNRDIVVFQGKLQVSSPLDSKGPRSLIDGFFSSLAEDQLSQAIGIVLSGTGSDGTQGLGAIFHAGGLTLVQEPSTAKYDGMPSSAIDAGFATHVLPVEKMPEIFDAHKRNLLPPKEKPRNGKKNNAVGRILMDLRSFTGHDFSLYKKSTIERRIERRMTSLSIDDIDVYAQLIKKNSNEISALFKELLINVTSFFRDSEAFEVLEKDILPGLCKNKTEHSVFRVWVAGCATGEEAYSIAIILKEWLEKSQQEFKIQIYATDLDEDAVATARLGIYSLNIIQDVSPERLRRFFTKEDNCYRIKKEIREMVVFATQNLLKDPPFTRLDLLSCRNLLIYLGAELQNQLIPVFHYALVPEGVLFLSPSEGIGNHHELFSQINRKWKFYRACKTASSRTTVANVISWTAGMGDKTPDEVIIKPKEINFAEFTRRVLIQCFAPASVLTDLKGNIHFIHGDTGKFLRPAPGQASLNIIEMAREGLELELRTAIRAATNDKNSTLNKEVEVKTNGGFTTIHLSVRFLASNESHQHFLLISFLEISPIAKKAGIKRIPKAIELGRIEELERDLVYLKENYQVTLEEQQASNEELKSTNEELQSTNEELQSTNEELETSKEELQSVNEELVTVNSELQGKIEQLVGMQNDMKNLLDNTHIGTIFLDEKLIIRRFTREATTLYRLISSDVGRLLSDIKSNLTNDELLTHAEEVLETLIPYEQEVQTQCGNWYLARIQPYRTLDNAIEGVVLTFTDINKLNKAEDASRLASDLAGEVVDVIAHPLLIIDKDLRVISANRAFHQFFKLSVEETIGRKIYELSNNQWDIEPLKNLLEVILPRDQVYEGYIEHDFPIIGHQKLFLNAQRTVSKFNEFSLILLMARENNGSSTNPLGHE